MFREPLIKITKMNSYNPSILFYGSYMTHSQVSTIPSIFLSPSKPVKTTKPSSNEQDFRVKYKTEVCRNWEAGYCEFGERCAFAHGDQELRKKQYLANNYKTKPCKQFFELGYCMYGSRCQFKHRDCNEKSPISTASSSPRAAKSTYIEASNQGKTKLTIFKDLEKRGKERGV